MSTPPFSEGDVLQQSWTATGIPLSCINALFGTLATMKCIEICKDMPMHLEGAQSWYWTFVFLGGVSLGICTLWSMHFVGMTGLCIGISSGTCKDHHQLHMHTGIHQQPTGTSSDGAIAIQFELVLTVLSGLVSSAMGSIGIHIAADHGSRSIKSSILGGCFLAAGAATMHYMGMASQSGQFLVEYNWAYVFASLVLALAAGVAGMIILFNVPSLTKLRSVDRILKSLVITTAVCAMHYTGMHSATYRFSPVVQVVSLLPSGTVVMRITDFLITVAVSMFSFGIDSVILEFDHFLESKHDVPTRSSLMQQTRFSLMEQNQEDHGMRNTNQMSENNWTCAMPDERTDASDTGELMPRSESHSFAPLATSEDPL